MLVRCDAGRRGPYSYLMSLHRLAAIALSMPLLSVLTGCRPVPQPPPPTPPTPAAAATTTAPFGVSGTFSIVAINPETGQCGAAVASRFPAVGKAVAYARAGVGAFCTQHWHHPAWGERALDLLAEGKTPERVLAELLDGDKMAGKRQLAIIDMQ